MARHTSSTIHGYIDQAWEDVTAHWARDLTHNPRAEGLPRGSAMNFSIDELKRMAKDTMGKNRDARIDVLQAEMDTLRAKAIADLPPPGEGEVMKATTVEEGMRKGAKYVKSRRGGLIHMVPSGTEVGDAFGWRTACMWPYARFGRYEEVAKDHAGDWCTRCLKADVN